MNISILIAAAINPSNIVSTSSSGYEIWNRGWSSADADKNRDAGIRGVLEAGWGPYKFNYNPLSLPIAMPYLNNSLDNPKQWTGKGTEPIF